jgi:hypothetical protein
VKRGFAFDWDLDKKKDAESNVEVYVGKSDPRRSVTHRLFYVLSLWRRTMNRSRLIFGDAHDSEQDSDQSSAGFDSLGFGGGRTLGIQAR